MFTPGKRGRGGDVGGIKCDCGYKMGVKDSRPHEGGVRRRRHCSRCGAWKTTFEIDEAKLKSYLDMDRRVARAHSTLLQAARDMMTIHGEGENDDGSNPVSIQRSS